MSVALEEWLRLAPPAPALPAGMDYNVFLSYRSVNRTWVINLYDLLRGHGHKVFLDQVTLVAGQSLSRTLERALEHSQAGVLIWSSRTSDSEWVRSEYESMDALAKAGAFHFVPIVLDDSPLPLFARNRVYLDFSQYPDGPNGGELLRLLHAIVGQPLSPEALRYANEQDEAAREMLARVKAAVAMGSATRLRGLFDAGGALWEVSPALGCRVAQGLAELGDENGALDVLAKISAAFPRAVRPRQLRALALARRGTAGDLDEAQEILGVLYESGERDPETLGILARTWMDRYGATGEPRFLRRSRDLYAEAFAVAQDDYYTGINAAAKSIFLRDDEDRALGIATARKVQAIVGTDATPNDYWRTATAAEAQLIQGNLRGAAALYGKAVAGAPEAAGSHKSTRMQAERLLDALEVSIDDRALVVNALSNL